MRIFRPKHTLASVIEALHSGLGNETIILEPLDYDFCPELDDRIQAALDSSAAEDANFHSEIAGLRARVERVQRSFSLPVIYLENVIRLACETRQPQGSSHADDLYFYAGRLERKLAFLAPGEAPPDVVQKVRDGTVRVSNRCRMLATSLKEELSIINLLSIELEISSAHALHDMVLLVGELLMQQIYPVRTQFPTHTKLTEAFIALQQAVYSRTEELALLQRTLEIARAQLQIQGQLHIEELQNIAVHPGRVTERY
jgi:hypothetical protein